MTRSIKEYTAEVTAASEARAILGKPANLSIVNGQLYWLEGTTQELFAISLTEPSATPRRVIDPVVPPSMEQKQISKEEELLRERLRTRVQGITSYKVRPCDGSVFFTVGTDYFFYHPVARETLKVFDYVSDTALQTRLQQKPCLCISVYEPNNGASHEHCITFVNDYNVYDAAIAIDPSGASLKAVVQQITTVGKANKECGCADYIMQEEFSRFTGHWQNSKYILYTHCDNSMLRKITLVDADQQLEEMQFPRVGDPNAVTTIVVYERASRKYRVVPLAAIMGIAPWVEYIPRLGFKDAHTIYFTLLSRDQEKCMLVSCPISSLPEVDETAIPEAAGSAPHANVTLTTEWSQEIPYAWVEVTNAIHFGKEVDILGCHAEEGKAFFHLQHRLTGGAAMWKPLTAGEWNVHPNTRVIGAHIYFTASYDSKLGRCLYSIPITGAAHPTLRSGKDQFIHAYTATPEGDIAYVASTNSTPAKLFLQPKGDTSPTEVRLNWSLPASVEKLLVHPRVMTIPNTRGAELSMALFQPLTAPPEGGYPLALYIYGGPHVQLIYDHNFDIACDPVIMTLLQHGIAVAVADNQMSNANGLRTLSICKKNMGNFETEDYCCVISHLTKEQKEIRINASRVAIYGWSYGGYATLLAMSQAPEVFKLGFSGAPVGDWRLYDSAYTERYMGVLPQDAEAYKNSSIAAFAKGFPDELNRVFIAHGLLDENVHFSHSCSIVTAMIEESKPYVMHVYPGERHGLRQKKASRLHYNSVLLKSIVEML